MPIGDPELAGVFGGIVINRDDPERLGRVKVVVPGIIENESAWAIPQGGGAKRYGSISVPPLGAAVYVEFVNRDIDRPSYRPGWYGKPVDPNTNESESQVFPEHQHPDIHVWGIGPFRVVVDLRDPDETGEPQSMRWKMVKEINGQEEDIVWFEINTNNSAQIHCDNSLGIDVGGILDLIGVAGVQVQERKVMRGSTRPIA